MVTKGLGGDVYSTQSKNASFMSRCYAMQLVYDARSLVGMLVGMKGEANLEIFSLSIH